MKQTILILIAALSLCAQTKIDIDAQTRGTLPVNRGGTGQTTQQAAIDALVPSQSGKALHVLQSDGTNVSWQLPIRGYAFASLPTPATGTLVVLTDAATAGSCASGGGSAFALCRYNGSGWDAVGDGGSGGGSVTIENNGTSVGTRPTVNIIPGTGMTQTITDTGTKINYTPSVDTATILTRAQNQAGTDIYCEPASASGANYTCSLTPALTVYTEGMTARLKPDTNSSAGAVTLNINSVGSVNIKQADGTTDPGAAALVAGQFYTLTYDGTVFRMPAASTGGGASAIDDLTDVTITSATEDDALTYQGSAWVNRSAYVAPAAYSSRPAANTVMPGTAFYSTEISNAFDVSDGTNWSRRLFGRAITPPTACTNWTIVDGTVSDTTCTDVAGTLQLAGGVDNDTFALMRAVPAATDFTVTLEYTHFAYLASASAYCGVIVSNGTTSASSALKIWGMSADGNFRTRNAASFQVATSNLAAIASTQSGPTTRYRYVDNGTNRTISVWTGSGWFPILSEGRTTTLTATHIGIGCTNFNAGYDTSLTIYEYTEDTP